MTNKDYKEIEKELDSRLKMIPSAYDRRKLRCCIQRLRNAERKSLISQVREEEKEKWAEVVALAYKIIDERRNKV